MNDINAPANAADAATPSRSPLVANWRRHVSGRRLRAFVLLSVAAHLAIGMSWGLPAYVKQKRAEAEQRRQEALREEHHRAEVAAVAKAEADDLARTAEDVRERTRKVFDNLTGDLPPAEKEKTWYAVRPEVRPAEQHLAEALDDRSMTEQDLRNLQADVDRRLVVAVNDTLNTDAGREEAEAFLAAVESRVVPALVEHYKGQLVPKVAHPVRAAADAFVKATGADASAAVGAADAGRRAVGDALKRLGDESDAAGGEVDLAQSLAARVPPAPADELHRHAASAAAHLAAATAAADAAGAGVSAVTERAKPLAGGSDLIGRLGVMTDSLSRARQTLAAATAALSANDYAGVASRLTALALARRKLDIQWAGASEAGGQASSRAEQAARGALALVQDDPIPQHVDRDLAGAFRDKASPRLAAVLTGALRARMAAAGAKGDDGLISATTRRLREILQSKVASAGGYGASTSQALRDAAGRSRPPAGAGDDQSAGLAGRFTQAADPIIGAGVGEVVADASIDARLAEMVSKPEKDPGRDDVRDRVAMLAARANDGRASALDSVSLTDLRASAMARSSETDRAAAGGTSATAPAGAPADGPPVIEDVKKEILSSLHSELRKVLEGKLSDEKAAKVWDHVSAAGDADVSRLSRDLIDPKVSDGELESRRLAFSGKFLNSIREALDKTASADVARQLLDQLQGKAGDAVADVFKNAVKENVGRALAREWREAADADGARAGRQARDVRDALDSAKAVADKAAQVLDQVKGQAARAARDGKGDPAAVRQAVEAARGKVREVGAAVAGAKADVGKAREDLPADVAEVKGRLAEVGKSFAAAAAGVTEADRTGRDRDPAAFAKAVADARKDVDRLREDLSRERAGLDREAAEAEARFIKAARQAGEDAADQTPGVKSRVEKKFDGEFRKEALPRLAEQIVKGYQQKLEQAGVTTDNKDAEDLHRAVAAALDQKVTGEAKVGEATVDDLENHKFFDGAKNARGEPTKEQADRANAIADKVTAAGVAATVKGDAADGKARDAVKSVAGPEQGVADLKDKVARMQGQVRGGRGGVLAEAAEGSGPKDDSAGLTGMRRKWQGILAGLSGDGEGAGGAAVATAAGNPAGNAVAGSPGGAGSAAGGAAGGAMGAGAGSGAGAGFGPGAGGRDGYGHVIPGRIPINEKLHDELVAVLKDRSTQQGEAWDRNGADGRAAQGARDRDTSRPAAILAPATQSAPSARNDAPYAPAFKSLRFAVVPYLNKSLPIGDNFDAWNDIPAALHLRPERAWLAEQAGLKIVDDLPLKVAWDGRGLYFMLDMPDPDGKISKSRLENFWQCDCLEVFVDTMNTKELQRGTGAGQQFWFWPFGSLDDDLAPGGESLYSRRSGFRFVGLKQEELPRFARTTPNGYQLQCRVPIERVRDADLVPGKILGFNVTVETGAKMHYYWSASKVVGTSVHPDTWGDILLGGSDGRVEFPDRLAAETGAGAGAGAATGAGPPGPSKLLKAFVAGEPLRIRVTDRDMNLNAKVKDKVSVTVRNARGEQEVAILEETGRDTGVFEGSVRTALALDERVPGIVAVNEGESVTVTYVDQARANGARNAEIVSRIVAGASVMADK